MRDSNFLLLHVHEHQLPKQNYYRLAFLLKTYSRRLVHLSDLTTKALLTNIKCSCLKEIEFHFYSK